MALANMTELKGMFADITWASQRRDGDLLAQLEQGLKVRTSTTKYTCSEVCGASWWTLSRLKAQHARWQQRICAHLVTALSTYHRLAATY